MEPFLVGAEGLEPIGSNTGETALSEKPGAQTGAIDFDSDSEGQIVRQELIAALQFSWMTAGRLDLYTEETAERQKIERMQTRLSTMMRELKVSKQ